jgi:hypothetical protein
MGKVPATATIAQTIAGDEIILHETLVDAFTADGVSGVSFNPVQHTGAHGKSRGSWFSIDVTSPTLSFSPLARFGDSIVDPDNHFACPMGDTAGHSLLSESILRRPEAPLQDFHTSTQFVESKRGSLVPYRLLYLSPRVARALQRAKPRKLYLEVARFEAGAT